ncbi:hypothetical protein ABZV60_06565 [Streptomyces sp. NPDC004787]|uniref:hypothetical protein n=1 Tax=Streptomyces sp. NPDC004787 TaxID=3154291 RepID=UPI0033A8D5BF
MDTPRYALLSGIHAVALCKDVDGLYGEPAPPPRVVHELRGCEPRGELARAVTEAVVEGTAPLGTLHVRTPDTHTWTFTGVRVLGGRGDVVTIESDGGPTRSYAAPPAAPCGNLVRVSPPDPPERTHTEVTFLGCSPRGELRDALAAGATEFGAVRYEVLRRVGSGFHQADAGRITAWDASATHRGLLDLTVAFPRTGLIPPQRRRVWDVFFGYGAPAEPGTWRRFGRAEREEWLNQAALRGTYGVPGIVPGGTYELDGTDIEDETSFDCALGEAVHGPGRAFSGSLAHVTLVWRNADASRSRMGVLPYAAEHRPPSFEELVDRLRSEGARVVLA